MPGGGGKGGGTSTVNVNNMGTTTLDVVGLDNQKITLSIPDTIKSDGKTELVLPQPFESKTELVLPQPFETKTEFSIPDPIKTESDSDISLDIKPLAMDVCLNINMGPLPETCIRQPYQSHFGVTLFGMELLGFNISGESQIIIQDLPKKPQVAWGGESGGHAISKHDHKASPSIDPGGGLRIRLGS